MNTTPKNEINFSARKLISVFYAVLFFCFISQTVRSQVSTYGFSESGSTYTALTTPSVAYTAPWDDHTSGAAFQATIGFNFTYNGTVQTES